MILGATDHLRVKAPPAESSGRKSWQDEHARAQQIRITELEEALAEALEGWASLAPLVGDESELARIEELQNRYPMPAPRAPAEPEDETDTP